ncbi:MAG TPA: RsmB/NOP family class I SAM-dependent RNA methyltransferase, partial [Smithellaceae bacterium]|nr:RsmB/NOP family class I SAM-dependent RNA methyltransferase [Smithellaceae bacterium]
RPVDLCLPLPPGFSKKFDRVLIDAPCSGTGTLRRNPEIKWRLKPEDIPMFSGNQRLILNSAAEAVKKGGRLVYCTCSVLPHENDDVIRRFLADHSDFTVEPPSDSVPSRLMDTRGFLRTYPHRHTIDGFFGAILKRRI